MSEDVRILIVDDEADIRDPLAIYLKRAGYDAATAADAAEARAALQDRGAPVDVMLLDIMMPGEDGVSLFRSLNPDSVPPTIFLTAMGEDTDRIVGLELGADDYVVKPFNPRELLARIKAVLRRTRTTPGADALISAAERYTFDDWTLDAAQRELIGPDGVATSLSAGEFRLLMTFIERPKRVLSRDQLLDLTQGREAEVFDRSIDNQVSRLRKKIEPDPKNPKYIKTVWGGGYRFAEPPRRSA
ncbi:MAG: response regulator [Pseudomonadota bacterium]